MYTHAVKTMSSPIKLREIFETAAAVRQEFETTTYDRDRLKKLYLAYDPKVVTPEHGIDDFIDGAEKTFPKGSCGLASLYLQDRLGVGEVITGTYTGKLHTFLALPKIIIARKKLIIVDTTADQFEGGPSVYVGPLVYPWSC